MWQVVKRHKGKEAVVFASAAYIEAFGNYEPMAAEVNAVDGDGKFVHPDVRISLRKVTAV